MRASKSAGLRSDCNARAPADKLIDAARDKEGNGGDFDIVYDNMRDVHEFSGRRSLPLKDAYALDEQLVLEAAKHAAKATGGKLTAMSARLLPHDLRADYTRITGEKIDDATGPARPGVTIKKNGKNTDITIDFKKALAGATARTVVLGITEHVVIKADRLDRAVENKDIPPYWIVISPREGKLDGAHLDDPEGSRSFDDPTHGQLIRAGTEKLELRKDYNARTPFATMTFTLDQVNDYGTEVKEPSEKTKPFRDSWSKHFDKANGYFDFKKAIDDGKLTRLTLAEAREIPGMKTLLSAIRENADSSITKLVKSGHLEFAHDPKTKSVVAYRTLHEESGGYLSVIDTQKKRWVGTFEVTENTDDYGLEWHER